MFLEWFSNATVISRADAVGSIALLRTHFVKLPPGSLRHVRKLAVYSHFDP